ncbi:hypothetical protein EMCG_03016 [[Emmonsia] crescens]|uniref:Uncharacterized protein n=1 Tax=[Emmonsia] crescens TaxID=73230 RepID=A0A0G2J8P8_9EURO|nr:hypothetical protein EMCG_03016 [Emmonsia crescens UAMH 3008]
MATTPPPRAIRTPPTPRHGARFDSFEPYSTRYSARLANRQASRGSPAPSTPNSPRSPNDADTLVGINSRKRYPGEKDSFSSPQSAQTSPARRSGRKTKGTQPHQTHSLFDNTRGQTDPVSHSTSDVSHSLSNINSGHTTLTANMLPTPAKTPRKKAVPDPGAAARTLFRSNTQSKDPEMPIPKRRKGKQFKGFSLESFNAELENEGNDDIMIFTDSRDRVPEVHEAADNPFISRPNDSCDEVGGSHEVQRDEKVQEALHRDDGMLYVFRGKKIFRKFSSDTEEDDETDRGLLASRPDLLEGASVPRVRPLTRSSIKPRLLFPNASQRGKARGSRFSDTEKPIDPEETCEADEPEQVKSDPDLPQASDEYVPATPPSKMTVSTPSTPLSGGRSLRSHTKEGQDDLGSPSKPSNGTAVRVSPFDRWTRTKSQASPATLRKRVGTASSDIVEPAMKKARSK